MAQEPLQVQPGAEFTALPLEFIISAPLVGAVKAQAIAAATTKEFIEKMIDDSGDPKSVKFNMTIDQADKNGNISKKDARITAPLLAIVPVPHLRIDSITTHFKYEISQVVSHEKSLELGTSLDAGFNVAPFFKATLKGNVTSSSKDSSVLNRSGVLEITVNASEAPMPEGLAKVLNLLANTIPAPATGGEEK